MRRSILPIAALVLSGCVHLTQRAPAVQDYRLDYPSPQVKGTSLPVVLAIPPFRVGATYDRDPIVYREGVHATGTYFYHRWSANPGNMIADLLARDFVDSGLYRAVQEGPSILPNDYVLKGDVEEIEERIRSTRCMAHLRLRVLLIRVHGSSTDPVRMQKTYDGTQASSCNDPGALVTAMSQVLERVSKALQQNVYEAVAHDQTSGGRTAGSS